MVARDERQHDFPRPTGQSQEGDPLWSHFLFFFYGLAVSKRFPLVVDFNGQFFDLTLVLSRRKLNVSKKRDCLRSRGVDVHSTSGEYLGITLVFYALNCYCFKRTIRSGSTCGLYNIGSWRNLPAAVR